MASTPSSTERVTAHSIARDFTAAVGQGTAVDAAAVKALQACQAAGVQPSASLYGAVSSHAWRARQLSHVSAHGQRAVGAHALASHCLCLFPFRRRPRLAFGCRSSRGGALMVCQDEDSGEHRHYRVQHGAEGARGAQRPAGGRGVLTTMMRSPSSATAADARRRLVQHGDQRSRTGEAAGQGRGLLIAMIDFGLVTPTSGTYASVVAAFARASNPASAEKWLQRMLETTSPTTDAASEVVGFNAALLAYSNAQDAAGALRVLEAFESRATDECPNAKPDVISYNTAMSACARGDQPANAEKIFHQMVKKGITPNQISFSTVIHAHAHAGASIKAQKWLDRMRAEGVAPDAISYNSVCAAHAKRGDVPSALACFNAMSADGVSPSPQTHAIMINALVQSGNAEQAEASLRVLLQSGERLEAAAFNALISLHGKNGEPFRAEPF